MDLLKNTLVIIDSDLDEKIAALARIQLVRIQAFYSSYSRGKSHFEDDVAQNYLLFQSVLR